MTTSSTSGYRASYIRQSVTTIVTDLRELCHHWHQQKLRFNSDPSETPQNRAGYECWCLQLNWSEVRNVDRSAPEGITGTGKRTRRVAEEFRVSWMPWARPCIPTRPLYFDGRNSSEANPPDPRYKPLYYSKLAILCRMGWFGHFHLHKHLWPLDLTKNHFIYLAIVKHEDGHPKFMNKSWDVKIIRGQSEDSLS